MIHGSRLMGLASRLVGAKGFSTELFVSTTNPYSSSSFRVVIFTTEEELKNVFLPFGVIDEAQLVRDNQTGRPKGFGFGKYSSEVEAQKAVKAMDERILRGRVIFVEIAKERGTG